MHRPPNFRLCFYTFFSALAVSQDKPLRPVHTFSIVAFDPPRAKWASRCNRTGLLLAEKSHGRKPA